MSVDARPRATREAPLGGRHRVRLAGPALVALVLTASLGACGVAGVPSAGPSASPSASPPTGASPALAGREFVSTGVTDGGQPYALVPGTVIRLSFRDGDLGASAGCNSIGGQYRIDGNRLVFSGAVMTEMACPDGRDAQDQWLVSILMASPTVILTGDELTVEAGRIVIGFLDRTVVEPDLPLVGTQWRVVGIIDGETVSSIPDQAFAVLVFNPDGSIGVSTGCNEGSGRWLQRDGSMLISDLGLTKKACGPPLSAAETAIVGVLTAGPLTVEIQAASMTLTAASHGLQLQGLGPD